MKNKICPVCGLEMKLSAYGWDCTCGFFQTDDMFDDFVTREYDTQFHIYRNINDLPIKN